MEPIRDSIKWTRLWLLRIIILCLLGSWLTLGDWAGWAFVIVSALLCALWVLLWVAENSPELDESDDDRKPQ